MSLYDYKPDDPKVLILFTRLDCEFCAEAMELCSTVKYVKIAPYRVFTSRVKDMVEIRGLDFALDGLPTLVQESEIPKVPMLFDPVLGQRMLGLEEIEKYFEQTGLI